MAVKGVAEFAELLAQESEFDYLCLPVGTGGTMAGTDCCQELALTQKSIGLPRMKGRTVFGR
ncbi:MAG: hypothetical protein U5K54_12245 [Cytophagales bacterium]|nr:hypothetical protein [Cytophagales bacterium]